MRGILAILSFGAMFGLFVALPAGGIWLLSSGYAILGLLCLAAFGGWWCWFAVKGGDRNGFWI